MSEYQYVAFRALDAPVTTENLKYMRRQSGHAEITPWSFESVYDFGDFHGNAVGMLQRGYDVHLHYANFGIRSLMLRLPHGFPDSKAAQAYLEPDLLEFKKDKKGPAGICTSAPSLNRASSKTFGKRRGSSIACFRCGTRSSKEISGRCTWRTSPRQQLQSGSRRVARAAGPCRIERSDRFPVRLGRAVWPRRNRCGGGGDRRSRLVGSDSPLSKKYANGSRSSRSE